MLYKERKRVALRSSIVFGISLFCIIFVGGVVVGITYGLQQVAGPIVVRINPGETKTFKWGLLTDKNQSEIVTISANGDGAQLLSFPKNVSLVENKLTDVHVNITIPPSYTGNLTLRPTIRATEPGESNTSSVLNIEMAKVLSITIGQNTNRTIDANETH